MSPMTELLRKLEDRHAWCVVNYPSEKDWLVNNPEWCEELKKWQLYTYSP